MTVILKDLFDIIETIISKHGSSHTNDLFQKFRSSLNNSFYDTGFNQDYQISETLYSSLYEKMYNEMSIQELCRDITMKLPSFMSIVVTNPKFENMSIKDLRQYIIELMISPRIIMDFAINVLDTLYPLYKPVDSPVDVLKFIKKIVDNNDTKLLVQIENILLKEINAR